MQLIYHNQVRQKEFQLYPDIRFRSIRQDTGPMNGASKKVEQVRLSADNVRPGAH